MERHLCPRMGKLHDVKTAILSKLTHIFSKISIKIPTTLFPEINKLIL